MSPSSTEQLNRCVSVVTAATNLNSRILKSYEEIIQLSLPRWNTFVEKQKKKNRKNGQFFNPLTFFKIGETKHSFLLRFLLDPNAEHGQGDLFLASFLKEIGVEQLEHEKWIIYPCEYKRIDILLERTAPKPSVIIIENKSNDAVDRPNQLYRYWYRAIHTLYPHLDYSSEKTQNNFKVVYLPSGDHKKYEEQSIMRPEEEPSASLSNLPQKLPLPIQTLTFKRFVVNWLHEITDKVPEQNIRLRTYLEFYKELCQSL